jgi:hypothetical protein
MMLMNRLFSTAILIFLLGIVIYSFKYPFEARLFPWVVGIPAALVMLVQTLTEFSGKESATQEEGDLSEQEGSDPRAYASIIAWMIGFLIMIYVLGFLVGIPLFVFLYLKTKGLGWFRSLALAVGLIIAIYGIFFLGMEMRLYPGLIFS